MRRERSDPRAPVPSARVTRGESAVWVWPVAVGAVAFACFPPALSGGFVSWDDDINLVHNPRYRGLTWRHLRWMFSTVHGGSYQPLSWVTFAVDHALWGIDPFGYHLTNVALHAANAVLVYFLALVLLRHVRPATAGRRAGAALAALLFALHPLRVESVAWVTERRDVLSAFFYLLALLAYLRMAAAEGGARRRWLLGSLAAMALSLLAKAWAVTLPVVLVALDAYPLGRLGTAPTRLEALREKAPFVALSVAGAVLAAYAVRGFEQTRTFAQHGVLARVAQASYGLCFYLWKSVLPFGLSPLYLLEERLNPAEPRYVACALAVLALTTAVVLGRQRWPWALVAWTCYTTILLPVLGLVQAGMQITADRYSYLACLPWALVIGAAVEPWYGTLRPATAASAAVLAVLAALTVRQARVWHDSEALWEHALRVDPSNYVAWAHRGDLRRQRGDRAGALADLEHALRLAPRFTGAYAARGALRQETGDVDGAIADYTQAVQLYPRFVDGYGNRAAARRAKGDLDGAIADDTWAIALDPDYARAWNDRGLVRQAKGDLAGAIGDLSEALRRDPAYPGAHYNRGLARHAQGDLEGAIADYDADLGADSAGSHAYNNRGAAREAKGDLDGAVSDYTRALGVEPQNPGVYGNRARARRAKGDVAGAAADYAAALRVAPPGWPGRVAVERDLAAMQAPGSRAD